MCIDDVYVCTCSCVCSCGCMCISVKGQCWQPKLLATLLSESGSLPGAHQFNKGIKSQGSSYLYLCKAVVITGAHLAASGLSYGYDVSWQTLH